MPQAKIYLAKVGLVLGQTGHPVWIDHEYFIIEAFNSIDGPRTRVSLHAKTLKQAMDHIRKVLPNV